MACPAIHTGESFLATALVHLDCQAQTLGSFGYGALAQPGSPVSLALASLLTIFIALFGIRLLLGYPMAGRDVVTDVLRIGIVLTLATSWPAWRILGYELVINGPQEVAQAIGLASGLPGSSGDLGNRLQTADAAIAALNAYGSGRLGVAQGDWFQLGFARAAFLTGTLGPLALIRLTAGILLAIAPLTAGLMLFGFTRSIFAGWVKGLVMVFLSSLALTLTLGVQLALMEPWLQDALEKRGAEQQILDAPAELLVVTLVFALISFGVLAIMARVAFHPSMWLSQFVDARTDQRRSSRDEQLQPPAAPNDEALSRAHLVANSVGDSLRREERLLGDTRLAGSGALAGSAASAPGPGQGADSATQRAEALGTSYRRNTRRISSAGRRRDGGA